MCGYKMFLALYFVALFGFTRASCPADLGLLTDVDQFTGDWDFYGGTPVVGKSLSRCGRFSVTKTAASNFTIKYTAISYRNNNTVTWNANGTIGDTVLANWQLEGSERVLGPFKHIVISANYNSHLAMVVCSEDNSSYRPGHKFSMIWSRGTELSPLIFEELKSMLGAYINQDDILVAGNENC